MANEFKVRNGVVVNGSGSTILDVQGSQGQLFAIDDSLSGSLYSVKNNLGVPVLQVFSDATVKMGAFGAEAINVSGSFTIVTGSLLGTSSYAINALSASNALNSDYALSSSFAFTSPFFILDSSTLVVVVGVESAAIVFTNRIFSFLTFLSLSPSL